MLLPCVTCQDAEILYLGLPPMKQKTLPDTGNLLSVISVALPGAASSLDVNVGASDSTDSSPLLHFPVSLKWKTSKDSF